MKTINSLLLLLLLTIQLPAQINIIGKVIDANSKETIPYVNIGIIEASSGTVSDAAGAYELKVNAMDDAITISSIGYTTINIKAENLSDNPIIELVPLEYEIEAVQVEASRLGEEKVFGVRNKNRGHFIGFGNAQLGTEIGAGIRIKKPTYIKSANFVLNHARGDSLLFRINIYKLEEGKVGENLLTENILIQRAQKKGTITVDMQPYNLILESDVLLTLEWLRNFDENGNKGITFDTKKPKN